MVALHSAWAFLDLWASVRDFKPRDGSSNDIVSPTTSSAPVAVTGPLKPLADYSLRILPLGDSITYGLGSATGDGYREDLIQDLQTNNTVDLVGSQEQGTMADNYNEGHSGYRIGQIADVTNASLAYNPDVVLLHAGTNDLIQDFLVSTAPERLGQLIDQILSIVPHTALLVAQIIPTSKVALQPRWDAFNAQVPGVVEQRAAQGAHVLTVNMSHLLDPYTDYADAWHPNDAGYALMATAWYQALEAANGMGWIQNATGGNISVTVNPTASLGLPSHMSPGASATGASTGVASSSTRFTASATASPSSAARRQAAVPIGSLFGLPRWFGSCYEQSAGEQW